MIETEGFYTLKGYQLNETDTLTSSMEDYLEMICRIHRTTAVVRISELAQKLHVKSSSASKMVQTLKQLGYVEFKKYGYITPTNSGLRAGAYLLYRHEVLHEFLCLLNQSQNELEQVEKMEHFINPATVKNMERLTKWLAGKPWSGSQEGCSDTDIHSE